MRFATASRDSNCSGAAARVLVAAAAVSGAIATKNGAVMTKTGAIAPVFETSRDQFAHGQKSERIATKFVNIRDQIIIFLVF